MSDLGAFQYDAFQLDAFQVNDLNITDTDSIQLPVNCVLAGQQNNVRAGRFSGRALKRAFNE